MKLPIDIISDVERKYWQKSKSLKALLKGEISFPINISLQSPKSDRDIFNYLPEYQEFISQWQAFEEGHHDCQVVWEIKNFQTFGKQKIPKKIAIVNVKGVIELLSDDAKKQLLDYQKRIASTIQQIGQYFDVATRPLFNVLVDNIIEIQQIADEDWFDILQLLPQLKKSMAEGRYLRALPVSGVDSKFIEQNYRWIELLLNHLYDNEVMDSGGLLAWLNCQVKPNDWLLIKPLCQDTKIKMANIPILRLNSQTLLAYELPADNILVVENEQSCLPLDDINNTIAVAGGGKNIVWLNASWLKHKKVYYWGDIDSDGLFILNLARQYCPHIRPIMMNKETVLVHQSLMVNENSQIQQIPEHLNADEKALFLALRQGDFLGTRLEQERLNQDFIRDNLKLYLS